MGGFDSVRHVRPSNGASVVLVQINGPWKIAGAKFDATSPDVISHSLAAGPAPLWFGKRIMWWRLSI